MLKKDLHERKDEHCKLNPFTAFDCLSLISLQIKCNYFHDILVFIKCLLFLVVVVLLILMNYSFKCLLCVDVCYRISIIYVYMQI